MDLNSLKQFVKTAPDKPGIYRYQSASGRDLYIGKAASIKKRLASYLKTEDSRLQKMIITADKVSFNPTDSDIEAMILESQMIKQKRPDFNIMLRDDKQYFYVAITREDFPHIFLTHQPKEAGARALKPSSGGGPAQRGNRRDWFPGSGRKSMAPADYIGPFTDGAALKSALRLLRSIFPYCTCTQKHHNRCLNYHIGKCLGFCCLRDEATEEEKSEYAKNIAAIRDILNGKRSNLVKNLKKEMDTEARSDDFDKAIATRTKLERLERVFENARIIRNSEILKEYRSQLQSVIKSRKPVIRIEGYDISNIQGKHSVGSMVTFVHGQPDKNYYRKFNIKTVHGANDTAMLREIVERRFNHPEWPFPDLIIVDGGKGQVNAVLKSLQERNIAIPVAGLVKDEKHFGMGLILPKRKTPIKLSKLSLPDRNLLLSIDGEAHRFAVGHYRHRHGKSVL